MPNEPKFFQFVRLMYQFQSVLRATKVKGRVSRESDAEHSYQLSMVCWYLNQTRKLKLNNSKLISYSLVHDLVELYAGDTDNYASTQSLKDSKTAREKQSLNKLHRELTDFPELLYTIERYEKKSDHESKFVYAIDKILPFINAYFYGQREYYQKNKVTYQFWKQTVENKLKSVDSKLVRDKSIQETLKYFSNLNNFYYQEKPI